MAMENVSRPQFDAALTSEQVELFERTAHGHGVARRVAFAMLGRSSDQLLISIMDEETAEALLKGVEAIQDYLAWRKIETEMLESASARLIVTLQWQTKHGELSKLAHE